MHAFWGYSRNVCTFQVKGACYPEGRFLNFCPGDLSISEFIATYLKIGDRLISPTGTDLQMTVIGLTV